MSEVSFGYEEFEHQIIDIVKIKSNCLVRLLEATPSHPLHQYKGITSAAKQSEKELVLYSLKVELGTLIQFIFVKIKNG